MRKLYVITLILFSALVTHGQVGVNNARTLDEDADGHIDVILIYFDQVIDVTTLNLGDIIVSDGYIVNSIYTTTGNNSVFVNVGINEKAEFDTEATPNVEVVAGSISNLANTEVVAAYDEPVWDFAPPAIVGVFTIDNNNNGYLDGVRVQFSENIDDVASEVFDDNSVFVNGYSGVVQDFTELLDDDDIVLFFNESGIPDTDNTPVVVLFGGIALDINTRTLDNPQIFTSTTDNAGPAIVSAVTDDTNSDGYIDRVIVTFSEDINGSGMGDFTVDGYTIAETGFGGGAVVELQVSNENPLAPDTDAIPTVLLNPNQVDDMSIPPNSIEVLQLFLGTVDGADPVIVSMEIFDTDSPLDGLIDQIQITWSEAVSTTDALPPIWSDYGVITLPDGEILTAGTVVATGDPEIFVISGINDQILLNTAVGQSSIQNFPIGAWVDGAENVNTGSVLSSLTVEDRAAPVITEFRYEDGNGDGRIDVVRAFFSEPLDETTAISPANFHFSQSGEFTDADFGMSTTTLPVGDGSAEVLIPLSVHSTPVDTESAGLQIDIQNTTAIFSLIDNYDPSNSNQALGPQTQASYSDGASPVLETVVTEDADSDGEIDQLVLTFSETIDQNSVDGNSTAGVTDDFSVDGYEISSVNTLDGVDNEEVVITLIEGGSADTDETPGLTILASNGLLDLSENNVTDSGAGITTEDGAAPVIYSSAMQQSNTYLEVVFSEPIHKPNHPGGMIDVSDFSISTAGQDANVSFDNFGADPMRLLDADGNAVSASEESFLLQLNLVPIVPDYVNENNTVQLTANLVDFVDGNDIEISDTETTGPVEVNDLTPLPEIISANWVPVSQNPFTGYIEIVFSENVLRGFDLNHPIRLTDTQSNGNLEVANYTGGSSTNCGTKELCIAYNDGGSGVAIGSDDDTDIQFLGNDGVLVSDTYTTSSSTFRLQLNDVSGPFTGVEAYTFSLQSGLSMRGAISGNYATFNYEYTFNLPDLVPAQFENATFQDIDNNGIADQVVVTLANGESFNGNTVQASEFSMGALQVTTFIADGFPDDGSITLNLSDLGLDGTEDLELSYTPNAGDGTVLQDSDGNEILGASIFVVDQVAPSIFSATTSDIDQNGLIDRMEIVFTENIQDASLEADFSDFVVQLNSYPILGYETGVADDDVLVLVLQERNALGTDTHLTPSVSLLSGQVSDGISALPQTQLFSETIDGAPPVIVSAETEDVDRNGFLDQLLITFSEDIDFSSVASSDGSDFVVSTPTGYAYTTTGGVTSTNSNSINLSLDERGGTEYDTGETPIVEVTGASIQDLAELPNTLVDQTGVMSIDRAVPVITSTRYLDQDGTPDGRIDAIELNFSEPVSEDSHVSRNDLNFTNASDFVGARFGTNNTDLIVGTTESLTVPLADRAENMITAETIAGTLQIQTLNNFRLVDDILPATVNTNEDLKIQSQAVVVDGAGPIITHFRYSDTVTPGIIDEFYLTFSEPLDWGNSYLSQNNLNLANEGNLVGASFGEDESDVLLQAAMEDVYATATPILLSNPMVETTIADGLQIALQNPAGGPVFEFGDGAGNVTNEGSLTLPGLLQSQALFIDDATPFIHDAFTHDSDSDGRIDRLELHLTESVRLNDVDATPSASGETDQLGVDGYNISFATTASGSDDDIILINLDEGANPDSDNTPNVSVLAATIFDLSGVNALATTGANPINSQDRVGPVIISAATVDNGDGHIDALEITFDDNISDASLDGLTFSDFLVDGYNIDSYSTGISANDQFLQLSLQASSNFDTDVTPSVTLIANEVEDLQGNAMLGGDQFFDSTTDGASPVILQVDVDDNQINASEKPVFSLVASEPVQARLDISSIVNDKTQENMLLGDPAEGADGSHTYIYTPGENGSLMNHAPGGVTVEFTIEDGSNIPDTDNSINVSVDNLVPTITIASQEISDSGSETIEGTISAGGDTDLDDLLVQLSIDGSGLEAATNNGSGSGTWQFSTNQQNGLYDIDAQVTDPFGNVSTNVPDSDLELQIGGVIVSPAPALSVVCIDGAQVQVGDIDVRETKENDFKVGQNRTLFLQLPAGVQFDVSIAPQEAGMTPDISAIAFDYLGTQTLRITMNIDTESELDVLRIQGIELKAVGSPGITNMGFLSGTASIFGLQNGASAVSLTSVAPPDSPLIFVEDGFGLPVSEVAVELGNESFTFQTEASGNTYNWYDYSGNLIHTGPSATTANLSVNTGPLGFDITSPGLYSLFVAEQNDQGCESERSKVNVYVYDREVNPETFTFVETDTEGSVLSMRHDATNFEGAFFGPGLGALDVASDPATAQFIPSIIGQGVFEITFQTTNRETLESYDFKTTYSVISGGSIFSNGDAVAAAYCNSEDPFVMDVRVEDIPEAGPISPDEFYFYGLRIRNRGTNDVLEDILQPPATWTVDYGASTPQADKPYQGWIIDPTQAPVGDYTIDRLIVPAGSTNFSEDLQVYNSIDLDINATPIVAIRSPQAYLCEDDDPIFLQATLNETQSVSVVSYLVTDLTNGNGSKVVVGRVFDSANPLDLEIDGLGSYPVGIYQVDYLSSPDDDPNGCVNMADPLSIQVLGKPMQKLLDLQENRILGHGELENGVYVFEYCEGEDFDDLSIKLDENEHVEWYTNTSLTNPLAIELGSSDGSFVSALDLFGYRTVLGGEDEDFYYVLVTESDLEGGCKADPVEVRFIGREIPDRPAIDLGSSEAGGLVSDNLAQFNYCSNTQAVLEPVELQALAGEESYYVLSYEENSVVHTVSEITSLSIDLNEYRSMNLSPGAHYEFQLARVTHDNSFNQPGSQFVGCSSEVVFIEINVHGTPNRPIQSQFSDGPNELDGRIVYYMCQGENLPDISINPPANVNEYLYQWYVDDLETISMAVLDNQGDRVTEEDLENAAFQFDRNTPGTYSMYVKMNVNVREDAFFSGCPSGLTQVDVVVSSTAQDPVIATDAGTSVTPENGFASAFNFCVDAGTGMPGELVFTADVGTDQDPIRWYLADESATGLESANPVAFGSQVTAGDLGISNVENGTFYFGVTHNTGIVNQNNNFEGFDGCLSNIVFFSVDINTIPGTSFSFNGITEGEGTTFNFYDPNATVLATGDGLIFDIRNEAGDLVTTHTSDNLDPFVFPFDSEGIYTATLSLSNDANCDSVLSRKFRILEKIVTNPISYEQDFDLDDGGWFAEFQSDDGLHGSIDSPERSSSWVHGVPNGAVINESASGNGSVWSTTGSSDNTYLGGERSYMYSPAFDISKLTNPTIRLKTIRDFDIKDGTVLQYSIDDGLSWTTLGDYVPSETPPSTGQYWYTENGISSVPGDISIGGGRGFNAQRVGWASKLSSIEVEELQSSNGWANSTHSLASIPEKGNVRFRIALAASGADGEDKAGDGFGFDDLLLFSQTRTVLIEQFSSSLSANSVEVNDQIADLLDTEQITYINYFTDLGNGSGRGLDIINRRNSRDPGARAAFYGVHDVPRSIVDGEIFEVRLDANTNEEILDKPSFNANDINIKSLEPPLFTIENVQTNYDVQSGILSMSASFVPRYEEGAADLSFYFGIVETIEVGSLDHEGNVIGPIGGYDIKDRIVNALRVLLPDAVGFNYVGEVASNEQGLDYAVDWLVDDLYNTDQLKLVVFVQNNDTKEVLQSMSARISGVSETVTSLRNGQFDKIYPNPSDDLVTVSFAAPVSDDSRWSLADAKGKIVLSGVLLSGSNHLQLDTSELPSGIYFVSVFTETVENKRKVARFIVEH